jgi:quercetin 2,3-dioxygenase
MERTRKVRRVSASKPTLEGAGVRLRRAFGFGSTSSTDPFLLLDDFRGDKPDDYIAGFPWHPHRGIETITYLLEGSVEHGDSLGNKGVIGAGDAQWMTAGSGIIHQEMPKPGRGGRMGGFQLWANLPASRKMTDPRYRDVARGDIPIVELEGGARVRVLCGEVSGTKGPVRDVAIDPRYLDVELPPGGSFLLPTSAGHTVLAYVFEGEVLFCGQDDPFSYEEEAKSCLETDRNPRIRSERLVIFGDGDGISGTAGEVGARFLLVSGKPLGESVAWYGPIVMNTREELETAFREYREGTFIKAGGRS